MRAIRGLVTALCVGASLPAFAQTYTVGVEDLNYLPHYGVGSDGTYGGFGRALLDAFAEDAGLTFEYEALPVARLFVAVVEGTVDFKYPDSPFWSRELKAGREMTYSAPVVAYTDGTMVQPEAAGQGPDAIATLGTVQGFTPWAWIDRIDAGAVEISENGNFEGLVRQALLGRVDGAYANRAVIERTLQNLNQPEALVFDETLPHVSDAYYLSTSTRSDVIARFDQWMADNADRIAAIKAEFGLSEFAVAD